MPQPYDVFIEEIEVPAQLGLQSVADLLDLEVQVFGIFIDKMGEPAGSADAVLAVLQDPLEGVGEDDVKEQMPLKSSRVLFVGQQLAGEVPREQELLEVPGVIKQPVPRTGIQILPLLDGLDEGPQLERDEGLGNPDIDEQELQPIHEFQGRCSRGKGTIQAPSGSPAHWDPEAGSGRTGPPP